MEFEYTGSVYVSNEDLRKMYLLCKRKSLTPAQAINQVSAGWEDDDYYEVGRVADQIVEEINRRLAQNF